MAQIQETIVIAAPRSLVFGLVRDQAQRSRFLPDGWRFEAFLSEEHEQPGAMMAIKAPFGPAPLTQIVQLQVVRPRTTERDGQSQLIESPPAADNFITTWTVRDDEAGSLVFLHTDFHYGGFIGEFFVRRRLRRAYRQMLGRLKLLAELDEAGDTAGNDRS